MCLKKAENLNALNNNGCLNAGAPKIDQNCKETALRHIQCVETRAKQH